MSTSDPGSTRGVPGPEARPLHRDLELLEAWRDGDDTAGTKLYESYFPFVCGLVRGKAADEEDLVHRVFESLVRSREKIQIRTSFRAYLAAVTRNELFADLKRRARDPLAFDAESVTVAATAASPSYVMVRRAEQRLLLEALIRIPLDAQIILELHYWEQLTTAELAVAFGIPRSTGKARLQRARALLEQQINALAAEPGIAARTTRDLDRWARSVREQADWELDR